MDRYSHYVTQAMAELRQWGYRPGLTARKASHIVWFARIEHPHIPDSAWNEAIHQLETAGGEQQ